MSRPPKSRRRAARAPARPKLPYHHFTGVGVCCNLPRRNAVHDPANFPTQTAEQREAEARRIGEHEEP